MFFINKHQRFWHESSGCFHMNNVFEQTPNCWKAQLAPFTEHFKFQEPEPQCWHWGPHWLSSIYFLVPVKRAQWVRHFDLIRDGKVNHSLVWKIAKSCPAPDLIFGTAESQISFSLCLQPMSLSTVSVAVIWQISWGLFGLFQREADTNAFTDAGEQKKQPLGGRDD